MVECIPDFSIADLSSLTVTGTRVHHGLPITLPALTQLALYDLKISEAELSAIVHPEATPNLRAVLLGQLYDLHGDDDDDIHLPVLPPSSLRRLDVLQLASNLDMPDVPYLFHPDAKLDNVAIQFYTSDKLPFVEASAVRHILLLWPSTIPYFFRIKPYRALTTLLHNLQDSEEAIGRHLRSISLPLPLRPIDSAVNRSEKNQAAAGHEGAARAREGSSGNLPAQPEEPGFDDGDEARQNVDEDDEGGDSGEETEDEEAREHYVADPEDVGLTGHENWLLPPRPPPNPYNRSTHHPSPRTQRRVRQILDFAAAHKIDIVWHDWDPRVSDTMVCEDFWRYVREKKAGTWRG